MSKQIRKILALLLSCAMVVTSFTFLGTNNLKAADEEAADQVELTEEQPEAEPTAETAEVVEPETTEETLEVGEETDQSSDEQGTTEEQKKPARPAQTLKATASDGAKIVVNAPEGALPEGASVKVKVVSAKSVRAAVEKKAGDIEDLAAYDITLHDADGNEIQPEIAVSVEINNADIKGKATSVYHVNDAKSSAQEISATTSGDDADFKASHFSIYVVVNGDPAVTTYKFVYDNGSEAAETQSIKDGETLEEPKTPAARNNEETFVGWYVGDKQFDTFGANTPAVTENKTVTLTAKFRSVIYVYFMASTADNADVAYTKEYKLEDPKAVTVDGVDVPMNNNQVLEGWYTDKALKNKVTGSIVPTKDTKLYPNIVTGHWLKFETGEGSYIEPIFVTGNTCTPAIPTRPGYSFLGWYTDNTYKTAFKFGGKLDADTEIYAKWASCCECADYTVIHWLENASNDEYSFKEAQTLSGKVGTTTAAVAKTTGDYKGFAPQTIEQKTIEKSGTIVNIYYKRQIYTLTFIGKKSCGKLICNKEEHTHSCDCYSKKCDPYPCHTGHYCYGGCGDWRYPYYCYPGHDCGTKTCKKEEHKHTAACYSQTTDGSTYTITAKYGAKIADKFNTAFFTETYAGYAWESDKYSYALQTLDTMPNFNATFNLYLTGNTSSGRSSNVEKTIYYYGTALPGDKDTVTYKGQQYTLIKAIKTYFTYMTYEEEYHNIEGFTRWSRSDAGFCNSKKDFVDKVGCLYYTRNDYTITFMNDGITVATKGYKYEQSIANAGFTPNKPARMDSNAQFAGWYDNQLCEGTPYNFTGKTMPAKNIVLYAKWKHVSSKVHVLDANTATANDSVQEVAYAGVVDQTKFPTVTAPAGKVFIGWGRLNKTTGEVTKFNLGTKIYRETWLVPRFAPSTAAYTVSYSNGTNSYTDTQGYLLNSEAELLRFEETGLTAPNGMMFAGWLCGSKLYLPGDEILMTGNVSLIAKWVKSPAKTKVTYNPGTGSGKVQTISAITNNGMYTLLSAEALEYSKENYSFVGWSFKDAKSGETKTLASGQVLVDTVNSDNNVFTAQWEKANANYTVNAYYENASGGFDAQLIATRPGKIGDRVDAIDPDDYTPKTANYTFAEGDKRNVTYGNVAANDALELKLYFKMKEAKDYFDIVGADASKDYDGTALETKTASVKEKGEGGKTVSATIEYSADGETWTASASDIKATDVADSKTVYVRAQVTGYKGYVTGTQALTINKRAVTAKSADITGEYNGKPLTNGDTELAIKPDWAAGEGATYEFTASQTLVDSCDNEFSITLDANTKAGNYDVTIQYGTLEVTDRENPYQIEVVAKSDKVTYDGAEHSVSGFKTLEFTVEGEKYTVDELSTEGGKGTIAGTYPSTITGTEVVYDKDGNDVSAQFEVTKTNGALVIDKANTLEINVDDAGYVGPYDAKNHGGAATVNVTADTEIYYSKNNGKTWGTKYPEVKDVDTVEVLVKAENPNYETATASYTINVYKADVKLVSEDLSKQYDGKPLTNGKTKLAVEYGWAEGEGAKITFTGSQTLVASSDNSFTYDLIGATKASNYNISCEFGCLTVYDRGTKYEATVVAKSYTCTYDGKPHSVEGLVTNKITTVDGNEYTVSGITAEKLTQTNAGTYSTEVTGKAKVTDADGNDVTAQFIVKGQNGTLTINKRQVTLRSADLTKVYDGKLLVNGDTALVGDPGWADGEGAKINFNGSQRTVGSSANSFGYDLNTNTKDSNYEITVIVGSLTVTPKDAKDTITVIAKSAECTYDGDEHEVTGLEETEFSIGGNKYYVSGLTTSGAKGTDANTYTNAISGTAVVTDEDGTDVSKYFNVIPNNGTLKIKKRDVLVKSGDLEKEYDGKILKDTAIANEPDWAEGEGATYTFTGTQKLPGDSQNKFHVNLNTNTKAGNYNISTEFGQLYVYNRKVPFEITVEANSAEVIFDNKYHEVSGIKTLKFKVEGEDYEVDDLDTTGARGKDAGTYYNNITGTAKVLDAEGYDVTAQFKVEKKNGTLVIKTTEGIGLDVGVADHEYVYNKTARGGDIATVSVTEGTTLSYSTDGGDTWVNDAPTLTDVGNISVTVKAENKNYDTEQKSYTITVTPATVKVTPRSYEKDLDKDDPDFKADVEGLYSGDSISYDLTREDGEDAGEYTISVVGDASQGNYTLNKKTGTLTIKTGKIGEEDEPDPENEYAAVAKAPGAKTYNGKNQYGEPTVTNKKTGEPLDRGTDYDLAWTKSNSYKNAGTKIVTVIGMGNYDGSTIDLEYVINPKTVTVQPVAASKEFGKGDPAFTAVVDELLPNDSIKYTVVRAAGEDVGEYTMSVAGNINQGNYILDKKTATFEITAGEIKPGPNPDKDGAATAEPPKNVTYNGKEQQEKPIIKNNKTGEELEEGVDYDLEYVPGGDYTNVGEKTVIVKGKGNYAKSEKIVLTYSINPKEIRVVPDNKTKKATETKDPELTAKIYGLVAESDKDNLNLGLVRDPGTEAGEYAIKVTGDIEQGNYKLVPEEGKFTITEGKIGPWDDPSYDANVKPISDTVYNGKEQKFAPEIIEKETGEALDSEKYTLAYEGDFVNVGTVKITITGLGAYENSKFVMTYKIKAAEASVEAKAASKRFGEAEPKLEAEVKNLVNDETAASAGIKYEISRAAGEDAGNYAITVSGDKTQGNYKLSYVGANFKIVAESIDPKDVEPGDEDPDPNKPIYAGVVVENPESPVYNGREQKKSPVVKDKNGNVLSEGKDYILIYEEDGDYTNVGEKTVVVKGIGNYTGEVTAKYTITPKTVTVTANNISITADQDVPQPTATVAGTIGDDKVEYEISVDGVNGVGTYTIIVSADPEQGNYKVTTVNGTLTIGKAPEKYIVVTPPQDPVYDGEEHRETPIVKDDKGNELVQGKDYELVYPDDDYTNAGTVEVIVKGINGYTGESTIQFTIQKRNVILTSASAKRAYNGKPLMKASLSVGGEGFVNGEGFIYKFNGSQTELGSSPNTFEYLISEKYANTKAENYDVTLVFGTLTVTKAKTEPVIDEPNDGPNNGPVIRAIANDGQIVLQEIADEETPLANFFDDCCILHMILLFMALCLFIFYMFDSKKRKNKIYELEEELAKHGVIYW